MKLSKLGHPIRTAVNGISRKTAWISGTILFLLVFFIASDVIGRYVFNRPIKGSNDIAEVMLIPLAFLAMAYTQLMKGHVRVKLVYSRFSPRSQAVLDTIMFLLAAVIYGLIAWNMGSKAWSIALSPEPGPQSMLLAIPYLPFLFVAALGSLILCLQLLVDSVRALTEGSRYVSS